jgi:hypothetical protein
MRGGEDMQTLVIEAVSLESARGFAEALSRFQPELVESDDGKHAIRVAVGGNDQNLVALLNLLEEYVTRRGDGPALVDLDGRTYKLHPADPS